MSYRNQHLYYRDFIKIYFLSNYIEILNNLNPKSILEGEFVG